jgi:hypothetical protein
MSFGWGKKLNPQIAFLAQSTRQTQRLHIPRNNSFADELEKLQGKFAVDIVDIRAYC